MTRRKPPRGLDLLAWQGATAWGPPAPVCAWQFDPWRCDAWRHQSKCAQRISRASPYEKNRYSSAIASAYARIVNSYPATAATSITSVDFGK